MKKLVFLLLAAIMMCSSCGYREGIIQRADRSYLQFTGTPGNAVVHIDDKEPFTIATGENKLYQIEPGKHAVRIYRGGTLLVDRVLILQNQTTMEVQVP